MKVYNQEKTQILENYDLEKGYLINDTITLPEVQAVEEQGHYETIAEYENGGKDVKWVVEVEGVEYKPERQEEILVYIPYTEKELERLHNEQELDTLLNNLSATDYIANKLIEAETEQEREQIRQEYAETLAQRRVWRNRASELKGMLKQE